MREPHEESYIWLIVTFVAVCIVAALVLEAMGV